MQDDAAMAPDQIGSEGGGIAKMVWQGKWILLVSTVAAFFVGVMYLHIAKRTYGIELKVTASASSTNSIANRLGNLGGLAAAAGLPLGGSSKAEPFDLYLDALTSREVADQLARDHRIMTFVFSREWNVQRQTWERPPARLAKLFKGLLGLDRSQWRQPDGARLAEYLEKELVVTKSAKTPITLVEYDSTDPLLGAYLLDRTNRAADDLVRARALRQASEYQLYLSQVLPTVTLAEVRKSLADSLSQQYETVMMAKSNVPYAAASLGAAKASVDVTKPKTVPVLALSIVVGLVLGILIIMTGAFGRVVRLSSSRGATAAA